MGKKEGQKGKNMGNCFGNTSEKTWVCPCAFSWHFLIFYFPYAKKKKKQITKKHIELKHNTKQMQKQGKWTGLCFAVVFFGIC